jgi:hypothetical protein
MPPSTTETTDSPAVLAAIAARRTYEALVTADHAGVLSPPLSWSLLAQQLRNAVRGLEGAVPPSMLHALASRAVDADQRALHSARVLARMKRADAAVCS